MKLQPDIVSHTDSINS